jgi:tetratricopeptide (TPR) repeat protein
MPPFIQKWGSLLVCLITAIVLFPSLLNGWVNWDDQEYVLENPYITSLSFENIKYLFTNENASNYHPLTMLSLSINYAISGLKAWSYHLFNWLIHLVNVFLVFTLCKKLFTQHLFIALLTALLFGIHPMHVESVAWVSERKDVLYVMFFLISTIQYLRYLDSSKKKYLIYTTLFFLLSLFSKPAAITLAPLLLVIDWYKGRNDWGKIIVEKIPFFALAVLFTFITYQIQETSAVKTYDALGFLDRIALGGTAFSLYTFKSVIPFHLNCFYAFPALIFNWMFFAAITATLFTIGWLYYFRKNKIVLFGSLFFLISISLYLHIISFGEALLSERYTYLSYIGIFILVAYFFKWIFKSRYTNLGIVLLSGYLIFLAAFSFIQSKVWNSGSSLWSNSIENMFFESAKPYVNLASAQIREGKENEALSNYEIALNIDGNSFDALNNSGIIYSNRKNYPEAIKRYNKALSVKSDQPETFVMRGNAFFRSQNYDAAITDYNAALQLNPNHGDAYNNRGTINYNIKKDYQSAFSDFNNALRINPNFGSAYLNRSRCQYQLGRFSESLADAKKAQSLNVVVDPNYINQIQANL